MPFHNDPGYLISVKISELEELIKSSNIKADVVFDIKNDWFQIKGSINN